MMMHFRSHHPLSTHKEVKEEHSESDADGDQTSQKSRSTSPPSDSDKASSSSCSVRRLALPSNGFDLDKAADFAQCQKRLMSENTRNFVVNFGREHAYCGFDMEGHNVTAWLQAPTDKMDARWINIWAPEKQEALIKEITKYYGISTRLRAMMCSDPSITKKYTPISPKLTTSARPSMHAERHSRPTVPDINEIENGFGHSMNAHNPAELDKTGLSAITFSQIVNQIWHFVSVDYGPKFMCIGYNSLYAVPDVDFKNRPSFPDGKRVWAWLILCNDNTVISIQENPFPHPEKFDVIDRINSLKVIRRNVMLVFAGLSIQSDGRRMNPLMATQVRNFPDTTSVKSEESASLLFYYLFDDWISSYSLVIKKEHSYSTALENLRQGMLEQAQVGLIDDLHRLGRQLGVLKRIYQSYELILTRILKRQRRLREEKRTSEVALTNLVKTMARADRSRMDSWGSMMYDDAAALGGVELAPAAASRFERLLDRIGLYALSEIDECITDKEALNFLVFNLIAMKDSQAVERLTRITILLAKVTILFLPVSLMTAYFSTEVQDLQNYTGKTYWIAFAVIMVLSVVLLTLFGWLSGTEEGKPIYRSITRKFLDSGRRAMGRRMHREEHDHGG